MSTSIEIPWNKQRLAIPLPARWRVLGTFAPPSPKPESDPASLCREALAKPISAAPLGERSLRGKRVLIVADDPSRPTPVAQFFGPVRDALIDAGVRAEDI